jgi:hypothetical protein
MRRCLALKNLSFLSASALLPAVNLPILELFAYDQSLSNSTLVVFYRETKSTVGLGVFLSTDMPGYGIQTSLSLNHTPYFIDIRLNCSM